MDIIKEEGKDLITKGGRDSFCSFLCGEKLMSLEAERIRLFCATDN